MADTDVNELSTATASALLTAIGNRTNGATSEGLWHLANAYAAVMDGLSKD